MVYDEEKDYLMRMIREVSRVLFSIIFGRQYVQVELEQQERFRVAGTPLNQLRSMVDRGEINEAENMLLEDIDYTVKEDLAAAVAFYQYVGEKTDDFLEQNGYSKQEVIDGLRRLVEFAGYSDIADMMIEQRDNY